MFVKDLTVLGVATILYTIIKLLLPHLTLTLMNNLELYNLIKIKSQG